MKRRRFLVIAGGAIGLAALGGCASRRGVGESRIVTGEAITRINAFRFENGRDALGNDRAASLAALDHARRMAAARRMAHEIGLGADFTKRMQHQKVRLPAAENIATGQDSVARALAAWESSASHRRNTLDPRFSGVGVAVAYGDDNEPYWAMVLAGG